MTDPSAKEFPVPFDLHLLPTAKVRDALGMAMARLNGPSRLRLRCRTWVGPTGSPRRRSRRQPRHNGRDRKAGSFS